MSTRERSSHRSHIAGPIILKIVCLKTPFASKEAHRYHAHPPFQLILFSFYPNKFPIQSGSGLTGTTCEAELASRKKNKHIYCFICYELHFAVYSAGEFAEGKWSCVLHSGSILVEMLLHANFRMVPRWRVTAVSRDQAYPDQLTGNHRGRGGGGGRGVTSVYCLVALPLYRPQTRPVTENISHSRLGTSFQWGANGTERMDFLGSTVDTLV